MNELKVYSKFVENLSKYETLTEKEYIDCCIKSIMGWNDKTYWERINEESNYILNSNINLVYKNYKIRGSSDKTNEIYKFIYNNDEVVGNDYHGYNLWKVIKGITFEEAKKEIKDKGSDYCFRDYRICHIWPCTKNIYLNNVPFNFFAIPSFCYCLSDTNNGGEVGLVFRKKLKKSIIKNCSSNIKIYNEKMIGLSNTLLDRMNKYINKVSIEELKKEHFSQRIIYILNQFILIPLNNNEYLEDGLKIFEYNENKIKFTFEYLQQKEIGFKDFI